MLANTEAQHMLWVSLLSHQNIRSRTKKLQIYKEGYKKNHLKWTEQWTDPWLFDTSQQTGVNGGVAETSFKTT